MDFHFRDAIEDLLVCGSCQKNFPLGNIVNFVQHKKLDCADDELKIAGQSQALLCQLCPREFWTPWSLMKHAQNVHALKIYLERSPLTAQIAAFDPYQDHHAISNAETVVDENTRPIDDVSTAQMSSTALLVGCESDALLQEQHGKMLTLSSSEIAPEQNTENSLSETAAEPVRSAEISKEDTENMTGRPTTLAKCCSSIVPKKRKRHMEIKHGGFRKRTSLNANTPTSIYIDLEPGSEGQYFHASVSREQEEFVTAAGKPESSSLLLQRPGLRRHSVIIQPGMTFSIPVSYSSVTASTALNCPVITDSSVVHNVIASSEDSTIDHLSSIKSALTSELTYETNTPAMSFKTVEQPSNLGEQRNDAQATLLDSEEQSQAQANEQRRRRYPTSRPFKCDQCDDSFNQRIHLKKHQSKHTGVKPFKCDQCDYSTVERSHLKVHIRVHTGEKPYKCTYCEYATAQNSTLKIHLKRHHLDSGDGERRAQSATGSTAAVSTTSDVIVCSDCGEQFVQQQVYARHAMQQHSKSTASASEFNDTENPATDTAQDAAHLSSRQLTESVTRIARTTATDAESHSAS